MDEFLTCCCCCWGVARGTGGGGGGATRGRRASFIASAPNDSGADRFFTTDNEGRAGRIMHATSEDAIQL